jgi:hypothetical protein
LSVFEFADLHHFVVARVLRVAHYVGVNAETRLEAVHYWHVYVQKNNLEKVRWFGAHDLNRLQPVFRSCDFEVRSELVFVSHLDEVVVVH